MEHVKNLIKAMLECFNQHGAQETPMARKNYGKKARVRTHPHTPTHPCIGNWCISSSNQVAWFKEWQGICITANSKKNDVVMNQLRVNFRLMLNRLF